MPDSTVTELLKPENLAVLREALSPNEHWSNVDYVISLCTIGVGLLLLKELKHKVAGWWHKKNGTYDRRNEDIRQVRYLEDCTNDMKELKNELSSKVTAVHVRLNSTDEKVTEIAEGVAFIKGFYKGKTAGG